MTATIRVVSVLPCGGYGVFETGRPPRLRRPVLLHPGATGTQTIDVAIEARLYARSRDLPYDRSVGDSWASELRERRRGGASIGALVRDLGGAAERLVAWLGEPPAEGHVRRAALTLGVSTSYYLALRARAPRGVSPSALLLLCVLSGQTVAELMHTVQRDESAVTIYLRQLDRARLAEPHGRRPGRWHPTDAGRALLAELPAGGEP